MSPPDARSGRDWAAATLVALGTLALVEMYPRVLHPDEATLLYEARRVLEGDVPYRDFFTLFAPGSEWILARLFGLFGPTFATARHAMAVLQAAIAGGMFLIARSVGVRPGLALAAALVHPAAALPQYRNATPHWFGTALLLALIASLVRLVRADWRAGGLVAGALAGALLFTEHPKGVVAIAGTSGVFLAGALGSGRRIGRSFVGFAVGLGVVAGGVALLLGLVGGLGPAYAALVKVPLSGYRQNPQNQGTWPLDLLPAFTSPIEPHFGVTAIMSGLTLWLPRLVAIPVVRTLLGMVRTGTAPRIPLVLAAGGVIALGAVSYNPNPVHLATILPVVAVVSVESAELGLSRLEKRGWRFVGWVPVVVLSILVLQTVHFPWCFRRGLVTTVDTSFGRLDGGPGAAETQAAQAALFAATSHRVFVYPMCPWLYLTAGLSNPTRFQGLIPDIDPPEHFRAAVAALESGAVPYVFRCLSWFNPRPDDPVMRYVRDHYEPMDRIPGGQLFHHKAVDGSPGRETP